MIEFKKKESADSNWEKRDPNKPFENCLDLSKLPKEVLDQLEKEGYDENDESKIYKFQVGDYTYQFKVWQGEWGCSRWRTGKKSGSGGGFRAAAGPREWSYLKMIDFEIGNLNDLREIVKNQELEEDESWELIPESITTTAKGEPLGVMKLMKRITMIGSEAKEESKSKED